MADDQVAGPSRSVVNKSKTEEYDPRLDFSSDKFDPVLALNHPGVSAPSPHAKRYDNLAAFESAMDKEKNPEKYGKKKEIKKTDAPIERRWLPHQLPIATQKKLKSQRNILARMEKFKGPLELLYKCVKEKLRIKVYTKNEEKTRGYCLAYVVVFDKHFNMALEDVTEVWTRRRKKKIPALDSVPSVKRTKFQRHFKIPEITVTPHPTQKNLENCTRHVHQLMVRGEQVVLISVVNEEKPEEKKGKKDSLKG